MAPPPKTAVALRDHLGTVGEDTTQGVLDALKGAGLPVSLASVRKTIWMLKRLGLLKRVSSQPTGPGRFSVPSYGLVSSRRGDPRWKNPSGALWPRPTHAKTRLRASRRGRGRRRG